CAGHRRLAGVEEGRRAGARDLPHPRAALHLPPRLGGAHRRSTHLLPRAVAGAGGAALRRPGRKALLPMAASSRAVSLVGPAVVRRALLESLRKLSPRAVIRKPVMFVVEVGAVLTSAQFLRDALVAQPSAPLWFTGWVSLWLWFTVVFAN